MGRSENKLSRRGFLKASGLSVLVLGVTGCSVGITEVQAMSEDRMEVLPEKAGDVEVYGDNVVVEEVVEVDEVVEELFSESLRRDLFFWFGKVDNLLLVDNGAVFLLIGDIGDKARLLAIKENEEWMLNLPRVDDGLDMDEEEREFLVRKFIALGYGNNVFLKQEGSELVGVVEEGGLLVRNNLGELLELTRPLDADIIVRWMGRAWVGGYSLMENGQWQPAVLESISGRESELRGSVLFTTDDCYNEALTKEVLNICNETGVKMTFFPNNPYVARYGDFWERVVKDGHEIAYHTSDHRDGGWTTEWLEQDFEAFQQVVREATGMENYQVKVVRPPFGIWNSEWKKWVEEKGLTTAKWERSVPQNMERSSLISNLQADGSLLVLSHPREADLNWFRRNRSLLAELADSYEAITISDKLLEQGRLVGVVGMSVFAGE